ncbi:MAG TPA: bifunctional 5,10-methylenetetrahydrofolate dehydrogenase/5,10-methenyltetrahydrofolate cyclohydrolase, partial [Candidatus Saccharimonadales bacterium]|nr:bifunctional 5,10-methylenetetrahydrofolate dehydrogenase/5,10-methenyltetrahydrofolate cyclohydrolase [Candidatus Saccharimonadales bacterium]
ETARLIDGQALSISLQPGLQQAVNTLKEQGVTPGLESIYFEDDAAARFFGGRKLKACEEVGMHRRRVAVSSNTTEASLISIIHEANADSEIHGIVPQLPFPDHINPDAVLDELDVRKDVDGLAPYNQGLMLRADRKARFSCTALAIVRSLDEYYEDKEPSNDQPLRGKGVTMFGKSRLIGIPVVNLLKIYRGVEHFNWYDTQSENPTTDGSEIVIFGTGNPDGFAKLDLERLIKGKVVVDAGTKPLVYEKPDGKKGITLLGDIDYEKALPCAAAITERYKGPGWVTVHYVLSTTIFNAADITGKEIPQGIDRLTPYPKRR